MKDTPRTDQAVAQSAGQWSFVLRGCSQQLERELTAMTEQRDEARRLAERYRDLSCDTLEKADETLLPWEITNQNSQAQARPALPDAECSEQPTNETK
jgi:hypothetical protein